jgi:outer membrane protein OmpA-like peptidoglycan-associated protein
MPAVNKPQPVATKAIKSASIPVREIPDEPETDKSAITLLVPRKNVAKVKVAVPELRPEGNGKNLTAGLPDLKPEEETSVPTTVTMPDADGDGITDSQDKCPYMKGEPGTGGCPDTDKDGIPDTDDQCPMVAGSKENNGCATEKSIAEAGTSSAEHIGNIEFKTGSAEVHGLYKLDIIEPALDSLLENNSMMLVITGHTDSEGDAPFNMHLSQSRADVVKAIFMKKGLPEERITTVAYGENMPIRDNVSDEGKQRNRRVEVHIIRKEKQ